MNHIYLIFSNTGTLLSKFINLYTKDEYVHVSLSFDNKFDKMYSFGRVFPTVPFIGGLVEENLTEGVYKRFNNTKCIIYKIPVSNYSYNLLKNELNEFLIKKDSYRYNFIGLFTYTINKPFERENHYFCSEFISHLLIESKIYNTDKLPSLIRPNDLLNEISPKELIYEGLASDLSKVNINNNIA